ncbi:MAG TPA: polyprenol monophosphomannose synthase [Amoebophilaceae bacterium]|nr:polyprenol monophosphomannose synthase [Amoebophilaceae bacterium]
MSIHIPSPTCNTLVVVPTYNECKNISLLLTAIFELQAEVHVLVVDDTSPDGTANQVIQLQETYPHALHLLTRPTKEGIGKAYIAGFRWGLAYGYEYICSMDADFSHAPADLLTLVATCRTHEADLAIGSRYVLGSQVMNWSYSRSILSHVANGVARLLSGLSIRDSTAGFACYRRTLLERFLWQEIVSTGYSFQVEMKYLSHKMGAKIVEVPIVFSNRVRGNSKMNLHRILESFVALCQIGWRNRFVRGR